MKEVRFKLGDNVRVQNSFSDHYGYPGEIVCLDPCEVRMIRGGTYIPQHEADLIPASESANGMAWCDQVARNP